MQPDSTDRNAYGLSPQQEQAALLLVSGQSVQETADQLGVHRTTLWHWRNLETFQAYLNALRSDVRDEATEGIVALHQKAVGTVERMLDSENDATALRAAALVLEAARGRSVGESDPHRIIKDRAAATSSTILMDALTPGASGETYERRCAELGIEPYQ